MDRSVALNTQSHFDNIADAYYRIVDRIWYDIGYFHRRERDFLREQLRGPLNLAVDAGCGPGRHLPTLMEHARKVVAIDFSRQMLNSARIEIPREQRTGVDFVQADVRHLPLRFGVADLVINFEVLEHLPGGLADAGLALEEFGRVLNPFGSLVVEVPLRRHRRWNRVWPKAPSYRELTNEEKSRYYEKFPLTEEHFFLDEDVDRLLKRVGFRRETKCFVRFLPSGLIEQHPLLEKVDEVLERVPVLNRICREALWYASVDHAPRRKAAA